MRWASRKKYHLRSCSGRQVLRPPCYVRFWLFWSRPLPREAMQQKNTGGAFLAPLSRPTLPPLSLGFLGAGGRLPKARRGRVYIAQFPFFFFFFLYPHPRGREARTLRATIGCTRRFLYAAQSPTRWREKKCRRSASARRSPNYQSFSTSCFLGLMTRGPFLGTSMQHNRLFLPLTSDSQVPHSPFMQLNRIGARTL